MPEASTVGGGAEEAAAAIADWEIGACGEGNDGGVGKGSAQDGPAVGGGAGGDGLGDVDAGVERDVDRVGVVGVDRDGVGGRVGEIGA